MMKYKILEIPYTVSSESYFHLVKNQEWPVYLNSNYKKYNKQRFDIISCNPLIKLIVDYDKTELITKESKTIRYEDPFHILKGIMQEYKCENDPDIPFCGGAIGFMSYDLGKKILGIQSSTNDISFPLMAYGIYDWAIIYDHFKKEAYILYHNMTDLISELVSAKFENININPESIFKMTTRCESNMNYDIYKSNLEKILCYIKNGDCYQVNYSQRFSLGYCGDEYELYTSLNNKFAAPYSSFMSFPFGKILSFSPERFLSIQNGHVETKPIKGTVPRSKDAETDLQNIKKLRESEKDRAENLMIVDLLRNDLSMNCELGSVKVDSLFDIETFANVHHLVSTVTGEVDHNSSIYDLIRDAFPGGSITGAPKIRSMEIIEELELSNRSVYCGSLGYIGFDESVDLNISIRTMLAIDNQLFFWGGGGIVSDSDIKSEYTETLDKVKPLLDTFSD